LSVTFQAPAWSARRAVTGRARTTSNDSFEGFSPNEPTNTGSDQLDPRG
jgi:hypothetical protein